MTELEEGKRCRKKRKRGELRDKREVGGGGRERRIIVKEEERGKDENYEGKKFWEGKKDVMREYIYRWRLVEACETRRSKKWLVES